MSKWNELKSWAEAVIGLNKTNQWDWVASVEDGRLGKTHTSFALAANPAAILELIAENERMREQCELNDMVHGTKGRERLAMLLKADADRASYWKQRAKSAEGHLYAGDMQQAARELHKRTSHSGTPWDELTVAQRAQIEGAVLAVVAAVNAKRDARQPVDCDMEASK